MTFIKLYLFSSLLLLFVLPGYSQVGFTSGGSNGTSSAGSYTGTYGQLFFYPSEGLSGSATQGVQQPLFITTSSAQENTEHILLSVNTFPNPTVNTLFLTIEGFQNQEEVIYILTDMLGRNLIEGKVYQEITEIDMEGLSPATYVLKIIANNNEKKSFNIIKNR